MNTPQLRIALRKRYLRILSLFTLPTLLLQTTGIGFSFSVLSARAAEDEIPVSPRTAPREEIAEQPSAATTALVTVDWPGSSDWIIPSCNDDASDTTPNSVDLIASGSQYGAAYYTDGTSLFVRERVDGNPGTPGNWDQFAWVFMVQKNIASTDYDYLVSLRGSGAGENVELWENTVKNGPIDFDPLFNDPAETQLNTWDTSTNSRVTATGTDYYVDWKIPLSELTSRGVNLLNSGLYFATSTNANNYNKDHLDCYNQPDVFIAKTIQKNHSGPWFVDGRDAAVQAAPGDVLTYRVKLTNGGGPALNQAATDELGRGDAADGNANVNPATQYSDWMTIRNNDADGNGNAFAGSWGDGSPDGQPNDTLSVSIPLLSGGGAYEEWTFDATVSNAVPYGVSLFENRATVGSRNADTDIEVVRTATPVENPPLGQACGLDIGLVVDSSGSIDDTELGQMKNAFEGFVDAFLPGTPTQMSVVEFDTNVVPPSLAFTSNVTNIKNRINASVSGGWTNWEDAIDESHSLYDPRPAKPDLIIFASDGNPNTAGTTPPSIGGAAGEAAALAAATLAANAAKNDGIRILALGIGDQLNVNNLIAVSGPNVDTGDATTSDVITTDFATMADDLAELADDLCGGKILVQKQFDTNGDGNPELDGSTPDPLLAGWNFDVNGSPSNPAPQTTTNTGSLEFSVLNGTYSVAETALKPHTALSSASCVKGTSPIGSFDPATRTISGLTMGTDETISCTFVNSATTGSLTVQKKVDADGNGSYEGGNAEANALGFRWGLDGAANDRLMGSTAADILGGPHSVSENVIAGYHFTGWYPQSQAAQFDCEHPYATSLPASVSVTPGSDAAITLCNARDTGDVRIEKTVVGGSAVPANWSFTIDGIAGTYHHGDGLTLPTGTYTIHEAGPADYTLTGVSGICANPSSDSATLTVTTNGGVCTFTNTRNTAGLTVLKAVDTDGDGDIDIQNATNWTWDLDGGNQNYPTGSTQTVETGLHVVSEDNQGGYHNISWACWNTASSDPLGNGVGTTLNVTVPIAGATCLFTNARDTGTITVNKEFDDDGNGTVDRTNPAGWTWDLVGGQQNNAGGATLTLPTDSYTVTEDGIANYSPTWACTDQTSGSGLSIPVSLVSHGQHIVCTFRNTRHTGTVLINKALDADGNGSYESGNTEATALGFRWGFNPEIPARVFGVPATGVLTGGYLVGETALTGYHFTGWFTTGSTQYSCANPEGITLPVNISVVNGQTTNITLCNQLNVTNITLEKVDVLDPVQAGDTITYNLSWTVSGNTNATNAIITDPLPAHTTFVSATDGGVESAGIVTWNLGTQTPGASGTVQLVVRTDSPLMSGTQIHNTAAFDTNETVPYPSDEWTTVLSDFSVDIEKTAPATVDAGAQMTYALDWSVSGNSPINTLTITDAIPTNTTFVSCSGGLSCGEAGGIVTWNLGAHVPGDSGQVHLTVAVATPLPNGTIIENLGELCGTAGAPGLQALTPPPPPQHCDQDGASTTVLSDYSVDIEKSGADVVNAGDDLTYTLAWAVYGNSPVDMLTITDQVPVNTTFVSASDGGTELGGLVTWNLGAHVPGESGSVTLTVHVLSPLVNGTEIHNTAILCGYVDGPRDEKVALTNGENGHCDDDGITTTVSSSPILALVKSDAPDPVQAGANLTYTINWSVSGNAPVTNLVLTDPIPANTTYVSATNGGVYNAGSKTITWNLGNHVPGENGSVSFIVTVATPLANGTILTNTATIDSTENDPVSDVETTTVASSATLSVAKSDSADPVAPGANVTYTLAWTVAGNSPVTNLVLTDTLPADLTFVSATGGGTHNGVNPGGIVTWNLGSHVPGDTGSVTFIATMNAALSNGAVVTNSATVDSDQTPPVTDTETTTVVAAPILGISKTVNLPFANPGDQPTYTVTVTNTGNDKAINTVLTDVLPAGFTFVDGGTATKTFSLGTIAKGQSVTTSYNVGIDFSVTAGTYDNLATAKADNHGAVTAKAPLEVRIPVVLATTQVPVIALEKRADEKTANPGDERTYVITISNTGNATANDVRITDTLPKDFVFTDTKSAKRTWMIGSLLAGEVRTITYTVTVEDDVKAGKHENTAVATAEGLDPVTAKASVDVRIPKVLGALVETGASPRDYALFLFGLVMACIAVFGLVRLRRETA